MIQAGTRVKIVDGKHPLQQTEESVLGLTGRIEKVYPEDHYYKVFVALDNGQAFGFLAEEIEEIEEIGA